MGTIRLLADKHIYQITRHIPASVYLELYDPDTGIPPDALAFDALLVRTVTKVNEQSLPNTGRLRWIGTASAGTDHLDTTYLHNKGIVTGSAAGCNARAVAEYVVTMLLFSAWKRRWDPSRKSVGIIGVGHVGSTVDAVLRKLGISTIAYDPPRSFREPGFLTATLEEVLSADILTLHLPYTDYGDDATINWLSLDRLASRDRTLLIQASRGGTADETAILRQLENGGLNDAVIDVWKAEPDFNLPLADRALVATPHIAGYSEQAKIAATCLALDAMFVALGIDFRCSSNRRTRTMTQTAIEPFDAKILMRSQFPLSEAILDEFIAYDTALRQIRLISRSEDRKKRFRELRTLMPYRNEYNNLNESISDDPANELLRYLLL